MKPYVLVVEDEEALATLLHYNLQKEGYETALAVDGEEAMLMVAERQPDLMVLDWMLPALSGIEVCRRLRASKQGKAIPIIMLTARAEEAERIRGLNTGADDYIAKPFSMPELLARIRAVLRRSRPDLTSDSLHGGDIVMDRTTRLVTRGGKPVHLGPTEYRLLEYFLGRPGRVLSRSQLLDAVWGLDKDVELRTVDVHIGRLRKALNAAAPGDAIRTVRGAGYALRTN